MTTAILQLPLIQADWETSYDADWRAQFAVGLDLSGISFALTVWRLRPLRRLPSNIYLLLSGSTETYELDVDEVSGVLNMNIPRRRMQRVPVGTWPYKIIASADDAIVDFVVGDVIQGLDGGSIMVNQTTIERVAWEIVAR